MPQHHCVSAALRTATGQVYICVSLGVSAGNCTVRADAVALCGGDRDLDTIVEVQYAEEFDEAVVVAPCGKCREILSEYGGVMVTCPGTESLHKVPLALLLPNRYVNPLPKAT